MIRVSEAEGQPERAARGPLAEALSLYAESAVHVYEHDGVEGLEQFVEGSKIESGPDVYLFDADGHSLLPRNPIKDNVLAVMQEARKTPPPQRVTQPFEGRTTWGRQLFSPSGRHYVFVARLRSPGLRPPTFPPSRIAVMLLTAGLVCYLLALYLSSPVKKLQRGVGAFGEGNPAARVAPGLSMRGDQLADLGRDFDHMAERIPTLIPPQNPLLADIPHDLRSPLARLSEL